MANYPYEGDERCSLSIHRIQEYFQDGQYICPEMDQEEMKEALDCLQQRLAKVRTFGGAFSQIELSPDIQMLLRKSNTVKTKLQLQG